MITPTCHPRRKHKGLGLCAACYQGRAARPRATACRHTDRPVRARGFCGSCYEEALKVERPEYRRRNNERQRALYALCREARIAYARERYRYGPGRFNTWASNLRRAYGITAERFAAMCAEQGDACAVCFSSFVGQPRRPAVDHCHTSGKVRGLLCSRCNTALGAVRDDPETLRTLAAYVEHHRA